MDAFCLVDFDNMPPKLRGGGVLSLAMQLRAEVLQQVTSLEDLHLRLYGGWYTASGLTSARLAIDAGDFPGLPDS